MWPITKPKSTTPVTAISAFLPMVRIVQSQGFLHDLSPRLMRK